MSKTDAPSDKATFPASLFGFTGRIGPKQYFIGIGIALVSLIVGFGFFASVMSPTGRGAETVFLAIPLFGLFVWILAAVTMQRLRDAGKSPSLAIVFILGPMLLLYPLLELLEVGGMLGPVLYLVILAVPGLMGVIPKDDGLYPNA